jgi:hypothetical protein
MKPKSMNHEANIPHLKDIINNRKKKTIDRLLFGLSLKKCIQIIGTTELRRIAITI